MRRSFIPTGVLILVTFLAIGAAACGDSDEENSTASPTAPSSNEGALTPIPANSELVVGPNRFSMGLLDADNSPVLGEPGTSLQLRFFFPAAEGAELRQEADARFVWAIEDSAGVWVANIDFDEAGMWGGEAVLTRDGEDQNTAFTFTVLEESIAPNIGDPALPSENLTLADVADIQQISTDLEPDPALYEMTVAEALQTGKPMVIVFATPAFCQTRFCGPVVDNVKEVKAGFEDQVNFIHIEPFELDPQGQLISGPDSGPKLSGPMIEWNFQSEPWVMVIDAEGLVAARFEGTADAAEIQAAVQATIG